MRSQRHPRPRARPRPRWKRRPEARPEEILDAALRVFGDVGFARARLEDVADLAGVSKGTLYRYFDSKESLFREMVRSKVIPAVEESERLVEHHDGSARELLAALIRRTYVLARRPELVKIRQVVQAELGNFPELGRFYFDAVILRARRALERVIERGVTAGEFRSVPHAYAARAIPALVIHGAFVHAMCRRFEPDPLTDEQALDGMIDFCLHGLVA
jgi:AcrR family transcriptional regulator